MNRRTFTTALGGAALVSARAGAQQSSAARKTRIYRLDYYYLRQGSQGTRVNDFLSSAVPVLAKNTQALGIFTALIGPHVPATLLLTGYAGIEQMEAADDRTGRNPEYKTALDKMEQGAEAPYDRVERVLLRATAFSPEIAPPAQKPAKPRVFELRVYHAPTERQLRLVNERFAGPEIPIFHRSGIHPVLYANTIVGPAMPNLTYLIPFAGLAEREKAWDAFGADPDWLKAREASIAQGGQIVADSNITLLRPTPYSPMQ
jgi:hypothetical protein